MKDKSCTTTQIVKSYYCYEHKRIQTDILRDNKSLFKSKLREIKHTIQTMVRTTLVSEEHMEPCSIHYLSQKYTLKIA